MEHMVKERNAGIGITLAGAVDIEADLDVSFFGGTGDGGGAGGEFEVLHGEDLVGSGFVAALDNFLIAFFWLSSGVGCSGLSSLKPSCSWGPNSPTPPESMRAG